MDRPAYLAGLWYPGEADRCAREIDERAESARPAPGSFHGLIGPHAGWAYSGDCAAHTYAWVARQHADADLVVIFGSHRGPHGPNTVFRDHGWETPLGALETDRALADRLAEDLGLRDEPVAPARPDNAVELHLPFVKHFFPRARFVMIGVAAADVALEIGRRAGELARDRDAVFIGSTDLTHYGPNYDFAPAGRGEDAVRWVREENDAAFIDALVKDDPRSALAHAVEHHSACCPGAAVAAVEAVRAAHGAVTPKLVEHYLSYDVRPDSSFVGYAGLVI